MDLITTTTRILSNPCFNKREYQKLISAKNLKIIHTDDVDLAGLEFPKDLDFLHFVYYTNLFPRESFILPESKSLILTTNYPLDLIVFPDVQMDSLVVTDKVNRTEGDIIFPSKVLSMEFKSDFLQDVSKTLFPEKINVLKFDGYFGGDVSHPHFPKWCKFSTKFMRS